MGVVLRRYHSDSILESIDSIRRDERGFPLTQYITNGGIFRARYNITHFKHHHRVLWLISNGMRYNIAIIAQFRCAPREVKNRHFGFLFLFLFFSSGPTAIVSYLLTFVYV